MATQIEHLDVGWHLGIICRSDPRNSVVLDYDYLILLRRCSGPIDQLDVRERDTRALNADDIRSIPLASGYTKRDRAKK
jgi:hypothetical protein